MNLLVEDFACSSDDAPDDMFLGMFFSRRGITALTHSRYFHQVSGSFCVCTCIRTHACMHAQVHACTGPCMHRSMHAQVHACKGMCELKECKFWYLCTAIIYNHVCVCVMCNVELFCAITSIWAVCVCVMCNVL